MSQSVIKISSCILLVITILEIGYYVLITASSSKQFAFINRYIEIEPKYPPITTEASGKLKYIRYDNTDRFGSEICFDFNETKASMCLSEKDSKVAFYLRKGSDKTKLSFSEMKKLVADNGVKAGDQADFTFTRQQTKYSNRDLPMLEQLTVYN